MHIESVHLHGFGRLAGREFRFGPGLTVVHGPNEAGKSTLHAALSAALFGLVGSGRRKRDDTARIERFRPWDGARYAATAEVVAAGGRRLRLEWDFDRARVAVVDAAAGTDVTRDYGGGDPDELVRALWGVERGVYLHLGHVAQAELARISDPAGVRHAIEAVVGQGAADSPAQAAVAALKEQRARLVGLNSAATKPLARARAERDRLADAVADAAAEREAVDELAVRTRLRPRISRGRRPACPRSGARRRPCPCPGSFAAASNGRTRPIMPPVAAAVVVAREAEHADFAPSPDVGTLRHRLRDLETERDRRSGERMLDTQRLTEVERERTVLAARAEALAPHRGASARAAEIDALALAAAHGGDGRRRLLGLIALAGAVAVAAVAVGQPALAALAVIAGTRRRSPWPPAARPHSASELDRALPGGGPVQARLAAYREACAADRELDRVERELGRVEVSYAGLRADLAALDHIEHERAQVSGRMRSELVRAGFDDTDVEDSLRRYDVAAAGHTRLVEAAAAQRQKQAELERSLGDEPLEDARRRLGEIESSLNGHAALADGRDLAAVETERAAAEAERDRAALGAAALDARLAERQRSAPRVAELREQLEGAIERVARLEHTDAVLRLAEAELAAAADETYRDVAPLLGAALAEPIGRLTAGRYATAFVEDDLGVRLETPERGEVVDLAALSHGTQRQVYLVQRLELVRLLCPEGATPPVLLDDPFAHVDAERVARTLAYLLGPGRRPAADPVLDRPRRGRPGAQLGGGHPARARGRRSGRRLDGGAMQPLRAERREAEDGHVDGALEADVAGAPRGVELAVEAEEPLELEHAVEAQHDGPREAHVARRGAVGTQHLRERGEVERDLLHTCRGSPQRGPGDQELHETVGRLATAPHRRERVPPRRRHEVEVAPDTAPAVDRQGEPGLRVGMQVVHRHREAAVGGAGEPLARDGVDVRPLGLRQLIGSGDPKGEAGALEPGDRLAHLADAATLEREPGGIEHRLVAASKRAQPRARYRSSQRPDACRTTNRQPRSRHTARKSSTRPGTSSADPIGSPATSAQPPTTR